MGDNETMVAETTTINEYTSNEYASTDYTAVNTNAVSDIGVSGSGGIETNSIPLPDGVCGTTDGSAVGAAISVMQDAPVTSAYDTMTTVAPTDNSGNTLEQENDVVESNQAVAYDSFMNGNGVDEVGQLTSMGNDANGTADTSGAVVEQQFDEVPVLSTEEERLWSIVKANSLDFNSWTALIEETERVAEDNILKIRKIYDAFLAEFPLCYGYWKKYAEHEARLSPTEKVVEVFERAVGAVTYSVDMWLHYCVFVISTYGDPDKVRRLFERGLAYVGTDYLSFTLWDKYIEYEYQLQQWCHLATIYTRILENPNQQLDRYFNSFKELAGSQPLSELRNAEEAAAAAASALNLEATLKVDNEVHPDVARDLVGAGSSEAEELEHYVAIREEIYKKAKEFDSKIIGFETAIRRPYFHVRPLNGPELENWHNYLDFIERDADFNKVVKLYERCLIACANYPEYWIRYVLCMEANGSIDLANNALTRATQVFVKRQPDMHLFAASFKERNGDIPGARASYQLVHSGIFPGLLEAVIKHANMERRLGKMEDAFSLYDQAIATEKGKEHSQTLPVLFIQYARFQYLVDGNVEKARDILDGALEHVELSKPFLEALIHLESVQSTAKRIDHIDSLVEKFIMPSSDNSSSPSTADREDLSCIYLEFLDLFGNVQTIKKASDRHAKLFLSHKTASELKKRSAEDFLVSEKNKLAKSSTAAPLQAQSMVGAYPSAQNQWPAGYGVQPQAWTQAPPVQGQQYPGYPQQVGYGGYSAYSGTYAPTQAPVSAPPSAAYGAYPQSYPAQQPYAQQNYAQVQPTTPAFVPAPVPAAASVPAQQPTAVSQSYYGSYY